MNTRQWLSVGIIVLVGFVLALGSGYWVYARQGHAMHENGHMMNKGQHGRTMGNGQHQGMMEMPMIHSNMSMEEMNQFCSKMQQRHEAMRKKRQQEIEKLNSLVRSMKRAKGTDKIETMQKVLVELVDQHNKRRSTMMRSVHSMMGSMIGMHQMDSQQRQRMMQRMQDCPMIQDMMNSSHHGDTDMSPEN